MLLDKSMAFTGSLFVCLIVKLLDGMEYRFPLLTFCGQQSLGVYVIHVFLFGHTHVLELNKLVAHGMNIHWAGLIGLVAMTLICLALIFISMRINILNRLLLGNKKRRKFRCPS